MAIVVQAPATSANLGPGFDCLGLALGLHNTVEAEPLRRRGWDVTVEGLGAGEIATGPNNLVVEAMRHLFNQVPGAPPGVRLRLTNAVPLDSGLGSSAAARAAGLVAANALCGEVFNQHQLVNMAAALEGHPDNVTPAVLGGLVVAHYDGQRLHYVRCEPPRDLIAVVAVPDQRLETAASRWLLPHSYPRADAIYNLSHAAMLVAALLSDQPEALAEAMQDRFHQPHRLPVIRGASAVLAAAREAGAYGAVLSGSGPSLLALCAADSEIPTRVAEAMREVWHGEGVAATTHELALVAEGARVLRVE